MSATHTLQHVSNYLLDLDGCVWFGDQLAPGAAELVAELRAVGTRVGFLTNTSSTDASGVAAKLSRLGIRAAADDVVTPMSVLLHQDVFDRPRRVLVVGTNAIRDVLGSHGVATVDAAADAEVVVVGRDEELTYARLAEATQALIDGAPLVALNLDPNVPAEGGKTIPGVGAIVAALSTASGVMPRLVGKPSAAFFEHALTHFGMDRSNTLMVGDRADVDVRGARGVGLATVLVGDHVPPESEGDAPDLHVVDLPELRRRLQLA